MNTEALHTSADVELRLPADVSFAHMLRTTTAALMARLDFTLDDIEDTRIAVTEAMAMLVGPSAPPVDLTVGYTLSPGHLVLTLARPGHEPVRVDRSGFAWQVLLALVEDVEIEQLPHEARLRLSVRSSAAV